MYRSKLKRIHARSQVRWPRFALLVLYLAISAPGCERLVDEDARASAHENEHEDAHGHAEHANAGPDRAVLAADEASGIVLADAAVRRLGLRFEALAKWRSGASHDYLIPADCLVYHEEGVQVFVRRRDRIRPQPVRILERRGTHTLVRWPADAPPPAADAELVTNGASLVRLAYLEAFGASGSGHGH